MRETSNPGSGSVIPDATRGQERGTREDGVCGLHRRLDGVFHLGQYVALGGEICLGM